MRRRECARRPAGCSTPVIWTTPTPLRPSSAAAGRGGVDRCWSAGTRAGLPEPDLTRRPHRRRRRSITPLGTRRGRARADLEDATTTTGADLRGRRQFDSMSVLITPRPDQEVRGREDAWPTRRGIVLSACRRYTLGSKHSARPRRFLRRALAATPSAGVAARPGPPVQPNCPRARRRARHTARRPRVPTTRYCRRA